MSRLREILNTLHILSLLVAFTTFIGLLEMILASLLASLIIVVDKGMKAGFDLALQLFNSMNNPLVWLVAFLLGLSELIVAIAIDDFKQRRKEKKEEEKDSFNDEDEFLL